MDESSEKPNLVEMFEHVISLSIDERGVYPQQGIVMNFKDELQINALALTPEEIHRWFWGEVSAGASEVIFGLDRTTKEGQGTEFSDVLTCCHWSEAFIDENVNWGQAFRIGVINYQNEPRIVRPMDWDNEFWKKQMTKEILAFRPPFRIKIKKN